VGLLTGIALGAAGAVAYSVSSGRDLREVYEEVRKTLDARDREAPGMRLETRFAEVQSRIEDRIAQVRGQAATAVADAGVAVEAATEQATEIANEQAPEQAPEGAAEGPTGA
jgi:hypothetical protein